MKLSAQITAALGVTETIESTDDPLIDANSPKVGTKLSANVSLNSTTTPAASLYAEQVLTLVAGTLVVDFTSLLKRGLAVSFSGKKIIGIALSAPATNAGTITLTKDATNGLALFGAAFSVEVPPGATKCTYFGATNGPAVDATHKRIDLTGTGTDSLQMIAIAG